MTTFHCDTPRALVEALLDERHFGLASELQTITGYEAGEYAALGDRLTPTYRRTHDDDQMLAAAASNLLGYPGIDQIACEEWLGAEWQQLVRSYLPWSP